MTGTAKVKPPKNNAEWARNTQKRLDQVEHPASARIGAWVLSTDPDSGDLIASNVNGGAVTLANPPVAGEDADTVTSSGLPYIKVERQTNQSGSRGTPVDVIWDTITAQTPEWGFTANSSAVAIPQDGTYLVCYHLAFRNSSNVVNKATLSLDGVAKMAQEVNPSDAWFCSFYMSETFDLNAGSIVTCQAYVSGSGTMDFGASSADPSVFTSLSLTRLPIG